LCLFTELLLGDFPPVNDGVELVFVANSPVDLADDLDRLVRFLVIGSDGFVRGDPDQIGSIESDCSDRSDGNGLAVTGTIKLRSVTDGDESVPEVRDRSICSALTGAIFKIPINNGSAIVFDNHFIVDSFIFNLGKYDNNS
jgi:hypothetical protein